MAWIIQNKECFSDINLKETCHAGIINFGVNSSAQRNVVETIDSKKIPSIG